MMSNANVLPPESFSIIMDYEITIPDAMRVNKQFQKTYLLSSHNTT